MDYKDTLNLPKTDFPMKANLSQKELEILKKWEDEKIYKKLAEKGKGKPKFILHDGPPYANGNIHIGHALNKILKDIIVKFKTMKGFYSPYVPGWDCHGLPIEHQVDKNLGPKKKELSKIEIRKLCREYAEKYINIQRDEFKRLGVFGDWNNPYLTMDYKYEGSIVRELGKVVEKGSVYRGKKPVLWCFSCETALAEAEVEYNDKESPSVYVKFQVKDEAEVKKILNLNLNLFFIIWTTTPWTLPANLAIALHPEVDYVEALVNLGSIKEVWVLAKPLLESCMERFGIKDYSIIATLKGKDLSGIVCQHPFIERPSKIILGEHVTIDAGTGCVHTAPGHGQEDYEMGLKYGLDIYTPVDSRGQFTSDVPEWQGVNVFKANPLINEKMKGLGVLIKEEKIVHSYPHCWRCKKPVIFRATEQWFISMEKNNLRQKALEQIDKKIGWVPPWGRNRIYSMIENRPDWCISRQRSWGVPITIVRCKSCNEPLMDQNIMNKIADMIDKEGADVWFLKEPSELLPKGTACPKCGKAEFAKEADILDVWFDSGVSHAAVLRERPELSWPADMYLEGSDQHRGWFHSSLLESIATVAESPYKTVLTHGFVVDGSGKKMSKSAGNVVAPQEVIKQYGAEILRLWVSAEDYKDDIRISKEILTRIAEAYRRIRNTCRFLLGNLYDFNPEKDAVSDTDLLEIDRWALHRLQALIQRVEDAYNNFEFHVIFHSLHNFCVVDMSSFYLDVLKDRIYTFKKGSIDRRAGQTVVYKILDSLVRIMAPILTFTADEVWQYIPAKKEAAVHLADFPKVEKKFVDEKLAEKWDRLLKIRDEVLKALEVARQEKRIIGHSLDAEVSIYTSDDDINFLKGFDLNSIFIVSSTKLDSNKTAPQDVLKSEEIGGMYVMVTHAGGGKCERCWNYSEAIGKDKKHPTVCNRCVEALS
ncbi:MAG: isoleucine--tRNA ligase [Nitrospirota bacterium]